MKIGIIGAGRAGQGLGLAFHQAGHEVHIHGRHPKDVPAPLASSHTFEGDAPWAGEVDVILLAVQDRAIRRAAEQLAATGCLDRRQVVLHLSGIDDEGPLQSLNELVAALGTMHPLQSLADPESAPDRLRGALAAITGNEKAVAVARALAESVGLLPVVIDPRIKAKYHAAAVIASNFTVVLAAVAEQLLLECGFQQATARAGLARLMEGTLQNVVAVGARDALTGPVVRGDEETVRRNLDALPPEVAQLYRSLAESALQLKRRESHARTI